jgi:hypothetical protein
VLHVASGVADSSPSHSFSVVASGVSLPPSCPSSSCPS